MMTECKKYACLLLPAIGVVYLWIIILQYFFTRYSHVLEKREQMRNFYDRICVNPSEMHATGTETECDERYHKLQESAVLESFSQAVRALLGDAIVLLFGNTFSEGFFFVTMCTSLLVVWVLVNRLKRMTSDNIIPLAHAKTN